MYIPPRALHSLGPSAPDPPTFPLQLRLVDPSCTPMRPSALLAVFGLSAVHGCTNILVTPKASADGHAMIAYNADDSSLTGAVSHWPAQKHQVGSVREVYSWDLGKKLGEIPEAPSTYNVMANANDQGLVIGETTMGGLSELSNVGKDHRNGTILD